MKMSKEDKIKRKKERAFRRAKKHNEDYHKRISEAKEIGYSIPLYVIRKDGTTDCWKDNNSPTGYSQKCSWKGICQYPCNGDC